MFIEIPFKIEELPVIEDVPEILDNDQSVNNEKEQVEEVFIENPDTGEIEILKKTTQSKKKVIRHVIHQSEEEEGPQPVEITEIFDTPENPEDIIKVEEHDQFPENKVTETIKTDMEEKPLQPKKKLPKYVIKSDTDKPIEDDVASLHEVLVDKPSEKVEKVTDNY